MFVCLFDLIPNLSLQDREKIPKQHLGDTVEELKRFNARRKLKGAVQAIAGGLANDPLCGTDTDSGNKRKLIYRQNSFDYVNVLFVNGNQFSHLNKKKWM